MYRVGLIPLLLASWLVQGVAQTKLENPRLHGLVLRGIDLTWQENYAAADSVFNVVIREFPDHPAGYVYKAGVMQSFAIDHEILFSGQTFDSLLAIGKDKAEQLCSLGTEARWGHYFLGTANGYDSYARVYRNDWFGGILKGLASVNSFERAIELDTGLVDARAGIGGFYYWRSRKTENFNWLPFVRDKRIEALTDLEKNADAGVYNRFTAMHMLITTSTDAGKCERAVEYARRALETYPSNRAFLWGLATALQKMGNLRSAETAYRELLHAIQRDPAPNAYNELVCRVNLGEILAGHGDQRGAEEQLQFVLRADAAAFPEHLRKRVEGNISRAKKLARSSSGQTGKTR